MIDSSQLPNLKVSKNDDFEISFHGIGESVSYELTSGSGCIQVQNATYTYNGKEQILDVTGKNPIVIGQGQTERKVFHYLNRQFEGNNGLRSGLTIHTKSGQWSSLPHDFELIPEPDFEEIFFYGLDGGNQRAIQVGRGVNFDFTEIDECWNVSDRDLSVIPMGYHPVVGHPNVLVSYLWAYIAKHPHWEKVK